MSFSLTLCNISRTSCRFIGITLNFLIWHISVSFPTFMLSSSVFLFFLSLLFFSPLSPIPSPTHHTPSRCLATHKLSAFLSSRTERWREEGEGEREKERKKERAGGVLQYRCGRWKVECGGMGDVIHGIVSVAAFSLVSPHFLSIAAEKPDLSKYYEFPSDWIVTDPQGPMIPLRWIDQQEFLRTSIESKDHFTLFGNGSYSVSLNLNAIPSLLLNGDGKRLLASLFGTTEWKRVWGCIAQYLFRPKRILTHLADPVLRRGRDGLNRERSR